MSRNLLRLLSVDFGYDASPELLFQNIDLHLGLGWTGVVGANGAGKSTLLRLSCGQLTPVAGSVSGPSLAVYCPQRTDHPPDGLELLMGASDREAMLIRVRLGLDEKWPNRWPDLSHGERKRLQIGAALYQRPDLLAVDEPTNHLDNQAQNVLLNALGAFRGIGLLVSHDRNLLDRLCIGTVFVDPPQAILRPGSYTRASREVLREEKEKGRRQQKAAKEVARLERTWEARRREAAQAGARRSKLKLNRKDSDGRAKIDLARVSGQDAARGRLQRQISGRLNQARQRLNKTGPSKEHPIGIEVTGEVCRRHGLILLSAGSIALGPGRNLIYPELLVRPGDKIAVKGSNGAGKSTLIKTLLASVDMPKGRLLYLPQEISAQRSRAVLKQARELKGVELGWVMNMVSRLGSRPQRLLASQLPSPGEARKLLLALGLRWRPWLIVLDEPTNHLDLQSIERLERALSKTPAALVLVSHDKRFLQALTDTNWLISMVGEKYILRTE